MRASTVRAGRRSRLLAVGLLALMVMPIGSRAEAEQERTVATSAEAWYRPPVVGGADDPACGLAGCPTTVAVPTNPYPEQTLHVGASNGRAESTTYLVLDLDPDAVDVRSGTLVLPVAPATDGTVAPELAELLVCLATSEVEPVEAGDASDAPGTDCNVATSAVWVDDEEQPRFEVDLARFVTSWEDQGLAAVGLVPDPSGTTTWHVALSAREREGDDVTPPASAVVELATTTAPTPSPTPAPASTPAPSTDQSPQPAAPAPAPSASPAPARRPAPVRAAPAVRAPALTTSNGSSPATAEAPQVAAPATPAPTPSPPTVVATAPVAATPLPYAHREVWLTPLALLLGGSLLLRTLQADVRVVADDRPSPDPTKMKAAP